MQADFDLFYTWAVNNLENVKIIKEDQIKANSIFCDDNKGHMYMSPSGGKNEIPYGAFICFKSGKKGNLAYLIAQKNNCSIYEARKKIVKDYVTWHDLEKEFIKQYPQLKEEKLVEFPEYTYEASKSPEAVDFLTKRKIKYDKLFYCFYGDLQDRIIIPYYDKNNNLVWWNARSIFNNKQRYLNCGSPKDYLFIPKYPSSNDIVFVVEGEFDALVLNQCGYYSCAISGTILQKEHFGFLKDKKIVLAFDQDKSGQRALGEIVKKLLENNFEKFWVCFPENNNTKKQDWNDMLITHDESYIQDYISKNINFFQHSIL